jgi:hypothetical protein
VVQAVNLKRYRTAVPVFIQFVAIFFECLSRPNVTWETRPSAIPLATRYSRSFTPSSAGDGQPNRGCHSAIHQRVGKEPSTVKVKRTDFKSVDFERMPGDTGEKRLWRQ